MALKNRMRKTRADARSIAPLLLGLTIAALGLAPADAPAACKGIMALRPRADARSPFGPFLGVAPPKDVRIAWLNDKYSLFHPPGGARTWTADDWDGFVDSLEAMQEFYQGFAFPAVDRDMEKALRDGLLEGVGQSWALHRMTDVGLPAGAPLDSEWLDAREEDYWLKRGQAFWTAAARLPMHVRNVASRSGKSDWNIVRDLFENPTPWRTALANTWADALGIRTYFLDLKEAIAHFQNAGELAYAKTEAARASASFRRAIFADDKLTFALKSIARSHNPSDRAMAEGITKQLEELIDLSLEFQKP